MARLPLATPDNSAPPRLRPRKAAPPPAPVQPPSLVDDAPLFLSVSKVAAKLDVSPDTVVRMVERGDLRGRRIGTGRCWRIEVASLTAWLARG